MGQGIQGGGELRPATYALMAPKSIPGQMAVKHLTLIKFKTELIISLMSVLPFLFPVSVNKTTI